MKLVSCQMLRTEYSWKPMMSGWSPFIMLPTAWFVTELVLQFAAVSSKLPPPRL